MTAIRAFALSALSLAGFTVASAQAGDYDWNRYQHQHHHYRAPAPACAPAPVCPPVVRPAYFRPSIAIYSPFVRPVYYYPPAMYGPRCNDPRGCR